MSMRDLPGAMDAAPVTIRDVSLETVKVAPPALTVIAGWIGMHVPDIIQFCMLIYAIGLAI